MTKLARGFFDREPEKVAYELVGRRLVRSYEDRTPSGVIVETAAYKGIGGSTANREGIQRPAGNIYIMPHRGMKFLNITTMQSEDPTCVWVRELYALEGVKQEEVNGPSKLTKALGIDMSIDGSPIDGEILWIEGEGASESQIVEVPSARKSSNCIAVYRLKL